MSTTKYDFTPFIPSDEALGAARLPDKVFELATASAELAGLVPEQTHKTITEHMAVINSYYSNLIEGNRTLPVEIRAALREDYSHDPAKRDLQEESVAHIKVQKWIAAKDPTIDEIFTPEFIKDIHREFYEHVPQSLRKLKNSKDEVIDEVIPGEWRARDVMVGRHHPPEHKDIDLLMKQFCEIYHPNQYDRMKRTIAAMCAHHRFAWIHPFADGNGRVVRLFTDAVMHAINYKSYGIWNLSRGLARKSGEYKKRLDGADSSRQGDRDGRGQLSEKGLTNFCTFMLDQALDQVTYVTELLKLEELSKRIQSYVNARNDSRVSSLGKLNQTAALILEQAFLSGELDRAKAKALVGASDRTASRLISQLLDEGLLSASSKMAPLFFEIPEHAEPWYFPDLAPGS